MNAYTRETLVERRQLVIRWSAVFAGALVAAGIGVPLHLLGANIAWSVIACIVALFAGGYVASQLAQSFSTACGGVPVRVPATLRNFGAHCPFWMTKPGGSTATTPDSRSSRGPKPPLSWGLCLKESWYTNCRLHPGAMSSAWPSVHAISAGIGCAGTW